MNQLELNAQPPEVIDIHVHMGPAFGNQSWRQTDVAQSGSELVALLDRDGVTRACTIAPSWEGGDFEDYEYEGANRAIYRATQEYPKRIIGICRVNPNLAGRSLAEMQRCHDEYGFRGLKLHPDWEFFSVNSALVRPFLDLAQKYRWPVLLHSGYYPLSQPALLLPVARSYPDVSFVLFHLGYQHVTDAIAVAERCPNVFLETSANAAPSAILQVIKSVGPERLIYGSALPSSSGKLAQDKVRCLPGVSSQDLAAILCSNAQRILGEPANSRS